MAEKVVLDLVANVEPIKEALAKLPPAMRKEASAAVRELEKEVRKAQKLTESAAKSNEDSWKKAGHTAEGVKRIFDAAGGSAAGYAGIVEHLTRSVLSLSAALGPMGVAAVAAAAAIGGVAAAGASAALKTSELVKTMRESSKNTPISERSYYQVQEMERSIQDLKDSMNELVVIIGSAAAPAVGAFADGLTVIVDQAQKMPEAVGYFRDIFLYITGIYQVWDGSIWSGPSEEEAKRIREYTEALNRIKEFETGEDIEAPKPKREDQREKWKAEQDAIKKTASDWEYLAERLKHYQDAQLDGEAAIRRAHERAMEALYDRAETAEQTRMAAKIEAEAEKVMLEEIAELHAKQEAERLASIQRIRDAEEARWKAEAEAAAAAAAEQRRYNQQIVDSAVTSTVNILGLVETLSSARASADADATESQRRAAKRAFAISKAAALVQAVISTSAGMTRAFQDIPYPYSIAAAAQIGIQGTAQTVAIAAQQPNFANGGVMDADHRPAMLQPGEGVLTRAGVNNIGGSEGIAAINQGRQGAGGPMQAYVVFDHRWFDRGARQNIQRGGAIGREVSRRSGPIGQREHA